MLVTSIMFLCFCELHGDFLADGLQGVQIKDKILFDFAVQVNHINTGSNVPPPLFLTSDTNNNYYWYNSGQPLQLTCLQNDSKKSALQWIDSHGFATDYKHSDYSILFITPDTEDDGLELFCKAKEAQNVKIITISLRMLRKNNTYIVPNTSGSIIYIKKHEPLYASCNGIVSIVNRMKILRKTEVITQHFEEKHNETTTVCVEYRLIKTIIRAGREKLVYERVKSKFIYYIEEEADHKDLSIGVITINSSERPYYIKMSGLYDNYPFYNGQTLQLTCVNKDDYSALQWIDSHGFATSEVYSHYLTLTLTPDAEDDGLEVSCKAKGSMKNATVTLRNMSKKKNDYVETYNPGSIMYVKRHAPLYASCDSIVSNGNRKAVMKNVKVSADNVITKNFEEKDSGTTAVCVRYKLIKNTKSSNGVNSFGRFKSKYVYCIKEDAKNPAVILSGGLGVVIFILLLIILIMWYRKKHGSTDDTEVIYEEIEDLPPELPPPNRLALSSYKVPKPLPVEEHFYIPMGQPLTA